MITLPGAGGEGGTLMEFILFGDREEGGFIFMSDILNSKTSSASLALE